MHRLKIWKDGDACGVEIVDYPFITPGDMRQGKYVRATQRSVSREGAEFLKRIKIPPNSVGVSCIGWQMGEAIMTDKLSFTNQQINTIVPNGKVEPSFLYYSLRPRKQELLSLGSAAGVRTPVLNKSAFCDLKVKIAPIPIQKRIVGILSTYDELLENCQQRIRILEAMGLGEHHATALGHPCLHSSWKPGLFRRLQESHRFPSSCQRP